MAAVAVAVAEVAAAGDRSIIRTARFVIMIAMLMMALLLQLNYSATTAAAAALTPTDSEPSATSTFHAPVFNVNQEFAPLDSRMLLKRIDLD